MLVEKGVSFPRYKQILNMGIVFFVCIAVIAPLWSLACYVFFDDFSIGVSPSKFQVINDRFSKEEKMKNGSLFACSLNSLNERCLPSVKFPLLEDRLILLEDTPRPDQNKIGHVFVLGLEGSHQKRVFTDGEIVYLNCLSEDEISFSDHKTPFYFTPKFRESNELEIIFSIEFHDEEDALIFIDSQSFALKKKSNFASPFLGVKGEMGLLCQFLSNLKIYEADLLMQIYGGTEFDELKASYRMYSGFSDFISYIKPYDLFIWKDEKLVLEDSKTEGFPLVKIMHIDKQKCELIAWDSEGVYSKLITLNLCKTSPFAIKPQELFLKLHQRTEASVTCQLHNRNVIIRKGDWLLYSKGKFRNLRTYDEVNDFLRYALKGELFIFDGIIKKEGPSLFVGHLFNEERSQAKIIEIPFSERKKQLALKKKEIKQIPMQVKDE